MKDKKIQNNYAFIDSNNLYLSAKYGLQWEIDYAKLRTYLKDKYNIQRAFLFIGKIDGQEKLYNSLIKDGFEIIFKKVVIDKKGQIKGNVDAEMVMWTMHYLYNNKDPFDKAMLITGDGDFYSLADYLQKRDKLLTIGIPNKQKYSYLLRCFYPKKVFFISKLRNKLERIPNKKAVL